MNDMGNLTTPPEVKQKKVKRRTNVWKWVGIALLTIVVATAISVVVGVVSFSIKGLGTIGGGQVLVCDDALVLKYNDAIQHKESPDGTYSLDQEVLTNLNKSITEMDSYENDATCQTMRFWIAIFKQDYDLSKELSQSVKSLHAKGQFANSNLRGTSPIFTYDEAVNFINPTNLVERPGPDSE